MQKDRIAFLLNPAVRAVLVDYGSNRNDDGPRVFKTLDGSIAVNDYVVVETATRHHMTVCKVVEVDTAVDYEGKDPINWVVQKVDYETYTQRVEAEKMAINHAQRAEEHRRREQLRADLMKGQEDEFATLDFIDIKPGGQPPE